MRGWLWDHAQQIPVVDVEASSADLIRLKLPKTGKSEPESSNEMPAVAPSLRVEKMAKQALAQRTK